MSCADAPAAKVDSAKAPEAINRDFTARTLGSWELAGSPLEKFDQFGGLPALVEDISAGQGVLDAVVEVILENLVLDLGQRRLGRLQLGEDVDAVAIFLHHPRDAADLTLDPAQAVEEFGLVLPSHAELLPSCLYTPWGCLTSTRQGYIEMARMVDQHASH